jgi:hypothetical protein
MTRDRVDGAVSMPATGLLPGHRGPGRLDTAPGRVDVWTTNERLQHYYLRQGFTYVRTVVLPHNPSGALSSGRPSASQRRACKRVQSLTG